MAIKSITNWANENHEQIDKAVQGSLVATLVIAAIVAVAFASQSMGQMRGIHSSWRGVLKVQSGYSVASLQKTLSNTVSAASTVIGSATTLVLYNYYLAKKKMSRTNQALLITAIITAVMTTIFASEALRNLRTIHKFFYSYYSPDLFCLRWSKGTLGRTPMHNLITCAVVASTITASALFMAQITNKQRKKITSNMVQGWQDIPEELQRKIINKNTKTTRRSYDFYTKTVKSGIDHNAL